MAMTRGEGVTQRWGMLRDIIKENCPDKLSLLDKITPQLAASYVVYNSTGNVDQDVTKASEYVQYTCNLPENCMKAVRQTIRELIFLVVE